jgi:hypothetical protein
MKNTGSASEDIKNANILLDVVELKLKLKNDAALSRHLKVKPPVISKIVRHEVVYESCVRSKIICK